MTGVGKHDALLYLPWNVPDPDAPDPPTPPTDFVKLDISTEGQRKGWLLDWLLTDVGDVGEIDLF